MNKRQLAREVAARTGLTHAGAQEVLNLLFDPDEGLIAGTLVAGERVTLPGFGTFRLRHRMPRRGTVPRTGEHIQIPGRPYIAFKLGRNLRLRVERDAVEASVGEGGVEEEDD